MTNRWDWKSVGRLVSAAAFLVLLPCGGLVGCTQGTQEPQATRPVERMEIVEDFWTNGQLRIRKQMRQRADGTAVLHGPYARWYDNGQKEYEATFDQGRKVGTAATWHRNGRKWVEEHYVDGEKHGSRLIWNDQGTMTKEEHYVQGGPSGVWRSWNAKGKIRSEQVFDENPVNP